MITVDLRQSNSNLVSGFMQNGDFTFGTRYSICMFLLQKWRWHRGGASYHPPTCPLFCGESLNLQTVMSMSFYAGVTNTSEGLGAVCTRRTCLPLTLHSDTYTLRTRPTFITHVAYTKISGTVALGKETPFFL
ncbi:hypothetical protein GDO81_012798 [Engystomops pustulosus]|uniref:Uncharacterized protein n=1 Tax=Engystomops pustulosus TaxID=76066 RepID=A0AAV7B114_ENGPU|nr:hypothetical protein GDO81_012798 [Engystomops pustulosus]